MTTSETRGVDILRVAEKHAPEVVYLALKDALARVEELEAALRKIKNAPMYPYRADDIACTALDRDTVK